MHEDLRNILSYLASEPMKAGKRGKIDRTKRLSLVFKILSEEFDGIKYQKEKEAKK
jgi:hypothetical protein